MLEPEPGKSKVLRIDDPYEVPTNPEVICESGKETVEESANKVIGALEELGYLQVAVEYQI